MIDLQRFYPKQSFPESTISFLDECPTLPLQFLSAARCWRLPVPHAGRFCFAGGRATKVAACDVAERRSAIHRLKNFQCDDLMLGNEWIQ